MSDLDAQVAALKKRITAAQQERAKAEHKQEVARERAEQARQALASDLEVTPAQVPALITKLEADLAAELARVSRLLDKAEEKA